MGVQSKSKDIAGKRYEIQTMGAREGSRVLILLTRFIGPSLAAGGGEGLDQDWTRVITKGLETFATTAKEADFAAVLDAFAARTKTVLMATTNAGPQPIKLDLDWDSEFAGNYLALITYLVWCVRENYGDFFSAGAVEQLAAMVKDSPGSESPKA